MSERKVLTKYYPPDFDPSAIVRSRKPKDTGPTKLPTVRLMAPFSMKCTTCGEFIYKGRKFNARKESTEEAYYSIKIIRFYIRCTRCSAEITFKTDPKNMDYEAERGAKRNFEPWREAKLAEETEEERLDRLEREEGERDPMKELEEKAMDQKTEMQIADSLDRIRTRNARIERGAREGAGGVEEAAEAKRGEIEGERERVEREDEEVARKAFANGSGDKVRRLVVEEGQEVDAPDMNGTPNEGLDAPFENKMTSAQADAALMPPPSFAPKKKKKQDYAAKLGIKKKAAA